MKSILRTTQRVSPMQKKHTMKKRLLSVLCSLAVATSYGQITWDINFEDVFTLPRVRIDTVSDTNNIWQIGHPDKTAFYSAHSDPNAIVTDTANVYPVNDTSSFTIIHLADGGWGGYPKVDIAGWYSVNSDSLTDYGYIDFSPDLGATWYRADSSRGVCSWGAVEELPTFTGNSNGWKYFYYCLQIPYTVSYEDTILYRFTFISDSVQTNKDGLMFDDLHFEDWAESIPENANPNLISIFPNPANDNIVVHKTKNTGKQLVQVFNSTGQVVYDDLNFNEETIDTRQFPNGIYLLKYSDAKQFAVKTFVVQH